MEDEILDLKNLTIDELVELICEDMDDVTHNQSTEVPQEGTIDELIESICEDMDDVTDIQSTDEEGMMGW